MKGALVCLAFFLVCCAGCVGDQRQRQEAVQPVVVSVPAPQVMPATDMKPVTELRSEVSV